MSTLRILLLSSIAFIVFACCASPVNIPTDDGSDWTPRHEAEMRRRLPPITEKELKHVVHRAGSSDSLPDRE